MNAVPFQALAELREVLAAFGRTHPEITRARLFGSMARGAQTPESDVDVVVRSFIGESLPRGLAGFAFLDDLEKELAARLNRPVNLIESDALENASRIGNRALPAAVARDARLMYDTISLN